MSGDMAVISGDLAECSDRIHAAQKRAQRDFAEYIETVGFELEKAQRLLANHHAGFGQWVKDEFGWNTSHADRLIKAARTMRLLSPIGEDKNLPMPSTESQCRPLTVIDAEQVCDVWVAVCERARDEKKPITAALVSEVVRGGDDVQKACQPVHEEMADAIKNAFTKFVGSLTTVEQFNYVRIRIQSLLEFLSKQETESGSRRPGQEKTGVGVG